MEVGDDVEIVVLRYIHHSAIAEQRRLLLEQTNYTDPKGRTCSDRRIDAFTRTVAHCPGSFAAPAGKNV
jgi:hypothetical protein